MTLKDVLDLLKIDLGITHTKRDVYFTKLIEASLGELSRKGIDIDVESADTDDVFLLVDYTAWNYRKRLENAPLAENLKLRIYNRKIRNRAGG